MDNWRLGSAHLGSHLCIAELSTAHLDDLRGVVGHTWVRSSVGLVCFACYLASWLELVGDISHQLGG